MNEEQQLKLQAYLDGELPAREAREIAIRIQRDREADLLLAELKNTRQAMSGSEARLRVPETREFYWSKIERGIQSCGMELPRVRRFNWAHVLWPVGAVAACFIVAIVETSNPDRPETTAAAITASAGTGVPIVETMRPDSEATTYCDEADGTTLVWFSGTTDVNTDSSNKPDNAF